MLGVLAVAAGAPAHAPAHGDEEPETAATPSPSAPPLPPGPAEFHAQAMQEAAAGHRGRALDWLDKAIEAQLSPHGSGEDPRLADLLKEKILLAFDELEPTG